MPPDTLHQFVIFTSPNSLCVCISPQCQQREALSVFLISAILIYVLFAIIRLTVKSVFNLVVTYSYTFLKAFLLSCLLHSSFTSEFIGFLYIYML